MISLRSASPIFVVLGLLAGCAPTREPIVPAEPAEAPVSLDWSKSERISLALDSFEFRPDRLTFARGQPYRLHLENHGNAAHNFDAPAFFRSLALKSDTTTAEITAAGGLVEIRPRGEADIYFVPTKSGDFSFECSHFLHASFGMVGHITVK
jgi:uncharacterized cupredoxin-like copper-binding protein